MKTVFALLLVVFCSAAAARDLLAIEGVATFTDERGECARDWRIARAPDGSRGCWTIGEHSRVVIIEWDDGSRVEFSPLQVEIYARVLP